MGFRSVVRTRHVNSHCSFLRIFTGKAPSRQARRRLDGEGAVQTARCGEKCHFEMSWFKMYELRAPSCLVNMSVRMVCKKSNSSLSPPNCMLALSYLPVLSGVIRANRANSSDSCESAASRYKNRGFNCECDSRESIRANHVANRPCH